MVVRSLLHGIVLRKDGHTLLEGSILLVADEGRADAETLLFATSSDKADGRNSIIHELVCQLATRHTRIADREVESVGNRLVEILVINDIEVMTRENLLQLVGTVAIDLDLTTEVKLALGSSLQHGSHGILGTMART